MPSAIGKLIITPWKWPADLHTVRDWFFQPAGDGPDMRSYAVDRVSVWKRRGQLPHEVHSTALLIDAVLHDDLDENSEFSVRATYSAAFCRFVTGLVDSPMKGKTISMFEKAKMIGLPASFVETRHYATHGDLPSLPMLRTMTARGLEWLWHHWWSKIDGTPRPLSATTEQMQQENPGFAPKKQIAAILKEFSDGMSGVADISSVSSKQGQLLVKLCKNQPLYLTQLAETLLEDGYFIDQGKSYTSLTGHFAQWDSLLRYIAANQHGFLCQLSNKMIQSLSQPSLTDPENDYYREQIYSWLVHFYISSNWATLRSREGVSHNVIETCIMNPGYWTDKLAIRITDNSADETIRVSWQDLVKATSEDHQTRARKAIELEAAKATGSISMAEQGEMRLWDTLAALGWSKAGTDWAPRPFGM